MISSYEMRQLIFEALGIEDATQTPWGHTFKMYGYCGSMIDLFAIVEHISIERGMVKLIQSPNAEGEVTIAKIPESAWGCGWYNIESDTSLCLKEIHIFEEQFHYLISQQILSPGWARNGVNLPFFHVTDYGQECIKARDILPYDSEGYIKRIDNCTQHDDWDKYYINQSIKCFNHGLYDAATMMLGIEGEYLAGRLIDSYTAFLASKEPNEKVVFENDLISKGGKISKKYDAYSKSWRKVSDNKDCFGKELYPDLKKLKQQMDLPADANFMTYLRQTRNELAHPSSRIMEASETLLLMVSFLKYFEIQNVFLDFYVRNK